MRPGIQAMLALVLFAQAARAEKAIIQPQGRKLQGAVEEPSFIFLPAAGTAALKPDAGFGGENAATGKKLEFHIVNYCPHQFQDKTTQDTEYAVQVRDRDAQGAGWRNLCGTNDQDNRALLVSGYWDKEGNHKPDRTRMTFACTDGAIVKCIDWGYRPDESERRSGGRTPGGIQLPFQFVSLLPYHQACTRMARADYCGIGTSNTVDGTQVYFYDALGHLRFDRAPIPDSYFFEAGWTTGPACCLSKKRWATLAISGPCEVQLPDPRKIKDARFCDDLGTPADPSAACPNGTVRGGDRCLSVVPEGTCQPLVYNYSEFIDAGLWRWRKDGESFTTTEGFWGGEQRDATKPPASDYGRAEFEGTVFASDRDGKPVVPASRVTGNQIVPLYVYNKAKLTMGPPDFFTTTARTPPTLSSPSGAPAGYEPYGSKGGIIGYVYNPALPPPQGKRNPALYSYVNKSGEHLTTTKDPSTLPPDYVQKNRQNRRLEGYLLAMPGQ